MKRFSLNHVVRLQRRYAVMTSIKSPQTSITNRSHQGIMVNMARHFSSAAAPVTITRTTATPTASALETNDKSDNNNGTSTPVTKKKIKKKKETTFVPRKAPVKLTESARLLFQSLLENPPSEDVVGIMLNYHQSSTGEPRMVFSFDFCTAAATSTNNAESVSLEVLEDGSPKPPAEAMYDGLLKLYIHENAFMKVLGATVDVDMKTLKMTLYDREGNVMDPNV